MGFFSKTVQLIVILSTPLALAQSGGSNPRAREFRYAQEKPENPAPIQPNDVTHGWGRAFLWSFEFIDFSNLLTHIAFNIEDPKPWSLYDNDVASKKSPLINRWIDASKVQRGKSLPQELQKIASVMSAGTQNGFREFPIDFVGGDVDMVSSDGYGWAPVTVAIAKNLLNFPFVAGEQGESKKQIRLLEVTIKAGSAKYPCNPKKLDSLCLVHYRYPTAATYKKLEPLLVRRNPVLWNALIRADKEGELRYDLLAFKRLVKDSGHDFNIVRKKNEENRLISDTYMKLNSALIAELISWVQDLQVPVTAKYQFLVAVHPFTDFNGRSLRMWYRRAAGRPLFLNDFYCDLYCNRHDFAQAVKQGNQQYDHIAKNILELSLKAHDDRNNEKRFYYPHQAFFEAAAAATSITNGRLGEFQKVSREYFTNREVVEKIKTKDNGPVFQFFQKFVREKGLVAR